MSRVLVAIAAIAGCGRSPTERTEPPQQGTRILRATATTDSTIAAADYIGPDACGECHPDQHASWQRSLHAVMNQRVAGDKAAALVGDFAAARVEYAGGTARFDIAPTGPTMTLSRGASTVRYRITRTIGVKALQEYVGMTDAGVEVRLPFGYWPKRDAWYPQAYFDPWLDEDDLDVYAEVKEPWAERCPWCHSTYPFEQRVARSTGRPIGHGLEQYFESAPGALRLDVEKQVTVGISCESCHLGGRAHAGGAAIHFVPLGATALPGAPVPTTFAEERRDPAIVNRVCAQCHSGPSPHFPDGSSSRNSSEALDLAASSCTTARCTDCHDPHTGGSDEARAIAACEGCHPTQATLRDTHAGHDTTTSCLDCHMPRIVMGVDRYVRTHRINSPSDRTLLASGAPNACNTCHLDRTIAWTVDELRDRYDASIDRATLDAIARDPDRDRPAGERWLGAKEPGVRLVATAAFARSTRLRSFALLDLLAGLNDSLPYVRTWTQMAVEEILGRKLAVDEYDARAPVEQRTQQLARLRERLRKR